jgi:hypothetical protein
MQVEKIAGEHARAQRRDRAQQQERAEPERHPDT